LKENITENREEMKDVFDLWNINYKLYLTQFDNKNR
jgi:hypothetical protein